MSILKKILVLIVVGAIAWFAYGYFMSPGAGGMQGGPPPVSVAEVIERDVQQWHEFSGRLVAIDQVEIRPQVTGTIEKVHFKDGARVNKGDLLFTIDPRPFQAAYDAAEARDALAESNLQRGEVLIKEKAIPQSDFDQRRDNAAVTRADLAVAKLNLEYTKITSPVSGRASRAEITEGNLVETGSSAPVLTTVVTSDPIYADFDADEATYIQYIDAKATGNSSDIPVMMGLTSETGTPHKGHIESFDNRLNTTSGTIRVRAVFDNPDGLLVPGLFARISLGNAEKAKAILITDRAVGTDQDKKFVLVVGADNKTEHREVKLGGMADGLRIVTEGLKPGEKIIVNGTQRVMMPGQPVKPEIVSMEDSDNEKQATTDQKKEEKDKKKDDTAKEK